MVTGGCGEGGRERFRPRRKHNGWHNGWRRPGRGISLGSCHRRSFRHRCNRRRGNGSGSCTGGRALIGMTVMGMRRVPMGTRNMLPGRLVDTHMFGL